MLKCNQLSQYQLSLANNESEMYKVFVLRLHGIISIRIRNTKDLS